MALEVVNSAPRKPLSVSVVDSTPTGSRDGEVYWIGQDGKVYLRKTNGETVNLGTPAQAETWNLGLNGARQIDAPAEKGATLGVVDNKTDGGGYVAPAKVLDTAQITSLDALLSSFDTVLDQSRGKAAIKRDTSLKEKEEEKKREEGKYEGKKLATLQDFAGAKTDTDLNTRNTLENLISSLSTLGLGGSRALTRQILDAANMSNRKANATQATNNRDLDSAWGEYETGNENDVKKIQDQYGYDAGEAVRQYWEDKQATLFKKADVYGDADMTTERTQLMETANGLNDNITGAPFMNPQYTGEAREMTTPDLADYTKDIGTYDTTKIAGAAPTGVTPVTGANVPGNLAVKAIAMNDKDLGIKKKNEGDLGLGV